MNRHVGGLVGLVGLMVVASSACTESNAPGRAATGDQDGGDTFVAGDAYVGLRAQGEACDVDEQCVSGLLCLQGEDAAQTICTTPCVSDLQCLNSTCVVDVNDRASCVRASACDDGNPPTCEIPEPECEVGLSLAYVNDCYACVDPVTCVAPQEPPRCLDSDICTGETFCIGRPSGIPEAQGCCIDTSAIPGDGAACVKPEDCDDALTCIGGSCRPEWMAATYYQRLDDVIPDDDVTGLQLQTLASCLATVPVEVRAEVLIEHPRPADLLIEILEAGGGITTTLFDHDVTEVGPLLWIVDATVMHPGDDRVNGNWTLRVVDDVAGVQGRMIGWSLYVTSRWD